MARLQRWQAVLCELRNAQPAGIDLAVVWSMDAGLFGGSKTFYASIGGYWENVLLQWYEHYAADFLCDELLPADLASYRTVIVSATLLRPEAVTRLAAYARSGGTLVLYGDSAQRRADTPGSANWPLLAALGLPKPRYCA